MKTPLNYERMLQVQLLLPFFFLAIMSQPVARANIKSITKQSGKSEVWKYFTDVHKAIAQVPQLKGFSASLHVSTLKRGVL